MNGREDLWNFIFVSRLRCNHELSLRRTLQVFEMKGYKANNDGQSLVRSTVQHIHSTAQVLL